MHFRLLPVASPRPFVALDVRRARALELGLLVSEFVDGLRLDQVWKSDERAVRAVPGFFAAMNARGVFHGDFHTGNALWNGREWVLLDLEGVRHRLRALLRRRLAVDLWARILVTMGDEARVRELFGAYLAIARPLADEGELWKAVRRRRDALAPKWAYAPLYP
jgi:predicted unusual protein kinase regulating ubiquinone biosynthesis (AarF/ABC1/UbiB family)